VGAGGGECVAMKMKWIKIMRIIYLSKFRSNIERLIKLISEVRLEHWSFMM